MYMCICIMYMYVTVCTCTFTVYITHTLQYFMIFMFLKGIFPINFVKAKEHTIVSAG